MAVIIPNSDGSRSDNVAAIGTRGAGGAPFGLDFAGGRLGPALAEALYAWWRLRDRLRAGNSYG